MEKRIITISREFGSGGRFLGEEIAKRLGIAYYDKDIIAEVEEKTGLAKEYIEQKGEYAPSKGLFAFSFVGRSTDGSSVEDYLYSVQREVILKIAEKSPCVIVGRNADYILKDRTDCINIFIHGDVDTKAKRISELYNKSDTEAKKLMHEVDKKRAVHYKYYTEQKWGMAKNYTMCLNSSEIGYEKCIEIIMKMYS